MDIQNPVALPVTPQTRPSGPAETQAQTAGSVENRQAPPSPDAGAVPTAQAAETNRPVNASNAAEPADSDGPRGNQIDVYV